MKKKAMCRYSPPTRKGLGTKLATPSLVPSPLPQLSSLDNTGLVPRPSPHVRERGSGVLSDFLVKWGGVAPRSESSNQIAERVIIGDDVQSSTRSSEGKLLSQLICYVLGRSKVGRSLLEFCKACLAQ